MNFQPFIDFFLDISKVVLGAIVAFVLYNINNKRSENRKTISAGKEKIVELREDKILNAINNLQSNMDGKFQTLQTDMDGKFTSFNNHLDLIQVEVASVKTEMSKLGLKVKGVYRNQSNLVTELRTLGVIKETPVLK